MLVMAEEQEKLLSRREAAEYANVHYNTIRQWEDRGLLHPRRMLFGRVEEVRIPLSELRELVEKRPEPQKPATTEQELKIENAVLRAEVQGLREQIQTYRDFLAQVAGIAGEKPER